MGQFDVRRLGIGWATRDTPRRTQRPERAQRANTSKALRPCPATSKPRMPRISHASRSRPGHTLAFSLRRLRCLHPGRGLILSRVRRHVGFTRYLLRRLCDAAGRTGGTMPRLSASTVSILRGVRCPCLRRLVDPCASALQARRTSPSVGAPVALLGPGGHPILATS